MTPEKDPFYYLPPVRPEPETGEPNVRFEFLDQGFRVVVIVDDTIVGTWRLPIPLIEATIRYSIKHQGLFKSVATGFLVAPGNNP